MATCIHGSGWSGIGPNPCPLCATSLMESKLSLLEELNRERVAADVALKDERGAKNTWYMRCRELERQLAMAADALGRVCVVATLRPGEILPGLAACEHAAVAAILSVLRERDSALRDLDVTRRERDDITRLLAAERINRGLLR